MSYWLFFWQCLKSLQGVKKVPDPKQNYIGLMTEG